MARLLLVLACLLLSSCTFGPRLKTYAPAHRPAGTHATIETEEHGTYSGEVLAVRSNALIVLDPSQSPESRIVQINYDAIRRGAFADPGLIDISSNYWRPDDRWRRKLSLHSRFPQDISPAVMDRLLHQHDQQTLRTIP